MTIFMSLNLSKRGRQTQKGRGQSVYTSVHVLAAEGGKQHHAVFTAKRSHMLISLSEFLLEGVILLWFYSYFTCCSAS